jgi:hypothetical protein
VTAPFSRQLDVTHRHPPAATDRLRMWLRSAEGLVTGRDREHMNAKEPCRLRAADAEITKPGEPAQIIHSGGTLLRLADYESHVSVDARGKPGRCS